jgi:hypothetical protein
MRRGNSVTAQLLPALTSYLNVNTCAAFHDRNNQLKESGTRSGNTSTPITNIFVVNMIPERHFARILIAIPTAQKLLQPLGDVTL